RRGTELRARPVLQQLRFFVRSGACRRDGAHMTQLAITELTKGFSGRTVLDHVDLQVPQNSLTAILGPSGSGKTTLLRVIAGFEQADSGLVTLGGDVVDGPGRYQPSERRRIGYVPQEGSLFPHLTVAANIGFGLP